MKFTVKTHKAKESFAAGDLPTGTVLIGPGDGLVVMVTESGNGKIFIHIPHEKQKEPAVIGQVFANYLFIGTREDGKPPVTSIRVDSAPEGQVIQEAETGLLWQVRRRLYDTDGDPVYAVDLNDMTGILYVNSIQGSIIPESQLTVEFDTPHD
jgi:hypothetical protein